MNNKKRNDFPQSCRMNLDTRRDKKDESAALARYYGELVKMLSATIFWS